MIFQDKLITCCDCSTAFNFSASEQEFFGEKGLKHEPKRCANCRLLLRTWRRRLAGEQVGELADVPCAQCGAVTKVPFQPKGHKPVFCAPCLHTTKLPEPSTAAESQAF